MSESGKIKKLKLNPPSAASRGGTPQGSRAGSPVAGNRSFSGSRASSPEGAARGTYLVATSLLYDGTDTDFAGQGRATPGPTGTFPTPAEVHAAIPPSGILTGDLSRAFRSRLGPSKENHQRFIEIVKKVSVYGKEDRMLRPGPWKET
jgi:transcription initiation factor TFIIF subunit alpha